MVGSGSEPPDHLLLKKVRKFHHLTLEGQLDSQKSTENCKRSHKIVNICLLR